MCKQLVVNGFLDSATKVAFDSFERNKRLKKTYKTVDCYATCDVMPESCNTNVKADAMQIQFLYNKS